MSASVVIFSDDTVFCHGLAEIVERAEALSKDRALRGPEIVLVDSRLPDVLTLCRDIRQRDGKSVILVAAPDDDQWASRALGSGARGIVLRTAPPEEIAKAIAVVRDGLIWAPRRVLAATIDLLAATHLNSELERLLSARERDVFRHAVRGVGNKEVAGSLAISEATVKVHMTRIFRKLGVQSRAELAAAYHGLRPDHAA